jgi:hypothetical protein
MNVTLVTESSSKYRCIIPPLAREHFIIEGRNYGMIWTKKTKKMPSVRSFKNKLKKDMLDRLYS